MDFMSAPTRMPSVYEDLPNEYKLNVNVVTYVSMLFLLAYTVALRRFAFDIKSEPNAPLLKWCGKSRKRFRAAARSGA